MIRPGYLQPINNYTDYELYYFDLGAGPTIPIGAIKLIKISKKRVVAVSFILNWYITS
jgi:hypothetical protein